MYKSCSRCGRIHDTNYKCTVGITYQTRELDEERKLRNTKAWANKSVEIRQAANYLCEVCRDQGIYTYDKLSVHHITKLRSDAEGLLDNDNLICLCDMHHKMADSGQIDAEYLRTLAWNRNTKR